MESSEGGVWSSTGLGEACKNVKGCKTKFYMLPFPHCHILPSNSIAAEEKNDKGCFSKSEAMGRFTIPREVRLPCL